MTPLITVDIISWKCEERLIKTLQQIPKSTNLPLNLCLHVQGSEKIPRELKVRIEEAALGFVEKDIRFTSSNAGIAPVRAANLVRAAKTPYIFMSDNDMEYAKGTIDAELEFLQSHPDYGMVDVPYDKTIYTRQVKGTKVICNKIDYSKVYIADIDLTGGTSLLIRQEVALTPNIIDTNYCIGSWDFDFTLNVRKAGWKVASIIDKSLIAYNDQSMRSSDYTNIKLNQSKIQEGRRLFESKWGFSCVYFPNHKVTPTETFELTQDSTILLTRAIYESIGKAPSIGVLTEDRIPLIENNFINSLNNQTDKEFKVCVIVGEKDNEATKLIESLDWKSLNVEFIYTNPDFDLWRRSVDKSRNYASELDEGSPEYIAKHSGHPTAPIMIRMDTDDWVVPGWISHIKHLAKTINKDTFLLNYQVTGQAPDGRLYKFYAPHTDTRTSPFIVLVQKSSITISPYENVHLRMGSMFEDIYTIPPSYCFMVIHQTNRSNMVYVQDEFIESIKNIKRSKLEQGIDKPKIEPIPKPLISHKHLNVKGNDWRSRMFRSTSLVN
jgi:hypothetical protein